MLKLGPYALEHHEHRPAPDEASALPPRPVPAARPYVTAETSDAPSERRRAHPSVAATIGRGRPDVETRLN